MVSIICPGPVNVPKSSQVDLCNKYTYNIMSIVFRAMHVAIHAVVGLAALKLEVCKTNPPR